MEERGSSVFTSHLLQIAVQQNAVRRRRSGGTGGYAASVLATKGFSGSKWHAPRWKLCCSSLSQGFGHTRQMHTMEKFSKGWPTKLGDVFLPNDTQAVSCHCWSAFRLQANVTVVPELVPYWLLILGEREKSGQYGSH